MNTKTVGTIMQVVAGVAITIALGLLIKWYPIHVGIILVATVIGFIGNKLYRKN